MSRVRLQVPALLLVGGLALSGGSAGCGGQDCGDVGCGTGLEVEWFEDQLPVTAGLRLCVDDECAAIEGRTIGPLDGRRRIRITSPFFVATGEHHVQLDLLDEARRVVDSVEGTGRRSGGGCCGGLLLMEVSEDGARLDQT